MSKNFVYYKDISYDDIDLKLQFAKDFYDRVDDSCKYLEGKSQKILTAVLTILALIATFYSALLNGCNNSQVLESAIFNGHILTNIILCIILISICLAGMFVSGAFDTSTVFYIGRNNILGLNEDKKKQLVEKYLNYAKTNLSSQQQKQSCFEKSLGCFKITMFFLFVYILLITGIINLGKTEVLLVTIFTWLKLHLVLITFLIILLMITICALHYKFKHCKEIDDMQKIREAAYYNSLKYTQNTPLENWVMAYDEFYMNQYIIGRRGLIYKLKLEISNRIPQFIKEHISRE